MTFVAGEDTPGTNGFRASLAVGVDFVANVLLAAGNPLHNDISGKGVLKRDLLVCSSWLHPTVCSSTKSAHVVVAVHTVHGGILVIAGIALDHPVDISLVGLGRLD